MKDVAKGGRMAERFDELPVDVNAIDQFQDDYVPFERPADEQIARLEAKIDDAFAASEAKLSSLETRVSTGFSRLECRLDRLFELQRRRRAAAD
jgi:hypothetical protein